MSEFDAYFLKRAEDRKSATASKVSTQMSLPGTPPDQVAKHRALGRDLGVPTGAVEASPEMFEQQAAKRDAEKILGGAPRTASWMQDYENQRLAKDDVENVAWWEELITGPARLAMEVQPGISGTQVGLGVQTGATGVKQIGTAAATVPVIGMTQTFANRLDLFSQAADLDPSMDRVDIAAALGIDPMSMDASLVADFVGGDEARRARHIERTVTAVTSNKEVMAHLVQGVKDYSAAMEKTQGRVPNFTDIDDISGFADWLGFSAGQGAPFLAAVFASAALGGMPAAAGLGYGIGVGDIQAGLIEEGVEDRPDLALVGGIPYAGLELLGPAVAPFRNISKAALKQVAEGYFKRLGRAIPQMAVEEFLNEAGQEIIKDIAVAEGTGEDVVMDEETLLRWFNSGMAGMGAAAPMSVLTTPIRSPGAAMQQIDDDGARSRGAGSTAESLTLIDEMAAASKLKERAPDKFQEVLEATGSGDVTIQLPASEMNTFFQGDISDEVLEQMGVDRPDFDVMLSTGGDISVSVASYATHFSGTDIAPVFAEHGRIKLDEMSVAEARAYEEGVGDATAAAIEEDMAAQVEPEINTASRIEEQLVAAGQTPRNARGQALVHGAFWDTMAEKFGSGADALAARFGLDIRSASDIPPDGATDAEVVTSPAAEPPPPTPDQVFNQDGARDVEIEVEMDDGTTETMSSGEVRDALDARRNDAMSLLECIGYA